MKYGLFLLLVISSFVFPINAVAQDDPSLEQGIKPWGSYSSSDIDSVSLSNGNLFFKTAIASLPQRGNMLSLDYFIIYNGKNWGAKKLRTQTGTTLQWVWN